MKHPKRGCCFRIVTVLSESMKKSEVLQVITNGATALQFDTSIKRMLRRSIINIAYCFLA